MTQHNEFKDPALLKLLEFFEPPIGDFCFRSISMEDLVEGLQRSPELRAKIMKLKPFSGRTGWSARTAQDMCRLIEVRIAAVDALK